ncbi:hypothetical protein Tco_0976596 [Tanacetum coccineum]|uniref:Uncharacterized protein n=1 Tax=Tanacetum coccineum TaxID=301880 RepID=A0ABQ5EHN6_9ASTR
MMEQEVLNLVVEMMLVIVEEEHMLGKLGDEPLVFDEQLVVEMIDDERVLHKTAIVEEVNSIVEQLVKAIGNTQIDCTEIDNCLSMEMYLHSHALLLRLLLLDLLLCHTCDDLYGFEGSWSNVREVRCGWGLRKGNMICVLLAGIISAGAVGRGAGLGGAGSGFFNAEGGRRCREKGGIRWDWVGEILYWGGFARERGGKGREVGGWRRGRRPGWGGVRGDEAEMKRRDS